MEERKQGKKTPMPGNMANKQEDEFINAVKAGIYKELHSRGLLTELQLNQLLGREP